MNANVRKIPFRIEFARVLELLAERIYQSPLALLRENTQNAYDAIRMRQAINPDFDPCISVAVSHNRVVVSDNGIGMSSNEMESNYWHAGRSGKNTEEARAAGVVGTFGIGAMANFGVADKLSVESESILTRERTVSSVAKSELSTDVSSISVRPLDPEGDPGTVVCADLSPDSGLNLGNAREYLRQFVEFVDIPIEFNGEIISGSDYIDALPSQQCVWSEELPDSTLGGIVKGDLEVRGMSSGELRVIVKNARATGFTARAGAMVLIQGGSVIRALRWGFGLSNVGTGSNYQWGGIVDLPFLTPTAGRESLDSSSNGILQRIVGNLDNVVSEIASTHTESFANDGFLRWVAANGRFDVCGPLEIATKPKSEVERLEAVVLREGLKFYSGRDDSVVRAYASEDEPLVVLSRRAPRRNCELGYLQLHGINEVDTSPKVEDELPISEQGFGHTALATRIARIFEEDYFLATSVKFGNITSTLPVFVTDRESPVEIYLDPKSTGVAPLLSLYREDFDAFGPFVKDFVRSTIFPRVDDLVPSSTREGAEAFLRHLRTNREWFEYEFEDKAEIEEILKELKSGRLSFIEATKKLADSDRSMIEVSSAGTAELSTVVREVGDETNEIDQVGPKPGIDRRNETTDALILTSETPVNGYTCFLSVTDRVQREKGEFFLQPHSTDVVWGGRKVIFIFSHHSGRFSLYYDVLCPELVGGASGGGQWVTSTILTKNRTFLPVPSAISRTFLPKEGERKRLEVRCEILYVGTNSANR